MSNKNQKNVPLEATKVKNMKDTLRRLVSLFKPYRVALFFIIAFAILSTVFNIVGPKIMGEMTTILFEGVVEKVRGIGDVNFDELARIAIMLLSIYVVSLIFSALQGYMMAGVSRNFTYNLRKEMHAKINRLPLAYFDKKTTGEVLSYVTNDIDTIEMNLTSAITQIITSITSVIGILVMMLTINWQMTLIAIIVIPLSFILVSFIFKKSQHFFREQQTKVGEINGHVEEMYSSHVIVKAFNGEESSVKDLEAINDEWYYVSWKSNFFGGIIQPVMNFVGNFGYVVVSIVGGYFASQGTITVGDIQSFIQYMRRFTQPIVQMGQVMSTLQSSLAAAERVFEFLDAEEETDTILVEVNPEEIKGAVTFDHVSFGYVPGKTIINDFSAKIQPGQKVAIVGPTGAGKTTIVKLLMRFYDVTKGAIFIDEFNIQDFDRNTLRSLVGMVLQDTWLYSGSILENIRYGNLNATDEQVKEAAQKAQVDHFVRTLEDGYNSILNEETSNISQGQKQLLTIARAILADPKILILDEATSSVDTRTEVLIQTALDNLMVGRTSFIIAHRLSTIRNADVILVMDQGDIVESGNHEELLAKDGFYAQLYNSQFSEDE